MPKSSKSASGPLEPPAADVSEKPPKKAETLLDPKKENALSIRIDADLDIRLKGSIVISL